MTLGLTGGKNAARARGLSLAELHAHDPHGGRGVRAGQRYLCPLPACAGHSNARKHRSFSVNADTGEYLCHRCQAKGVLEEHATPRDRREAARSAKAVTLARFGIYRSPHARAREATTDTTTFEAALRGTAPLRGTPAEVYLRGRGIELPEAKGIAGFARSWLAGGPAVVFPCRTSAGAVIALQGRFLGQETPKAKSVGPIGAGVFATPGALEAKVVAIAEAPLDALSLAAAVASVGKNDLGVVALFCCGSDRQRAMLRKALAFRTVLLATDADPAGDAAALELRKALSLGTRCVRLEYPAGVKDANEWLRRDRDELAAVLARLTSGPALENPARAYDARPSATTPTAEEGEDLLAYARRRLA